MAATPTDVATTPGASCPDPLPIEQWDMWIGDALLRITIWAAKNGYTGSLDEAVVDYVVREAVAARAVRPDAATQVEVAVDDGRVVRRYEPSAGQVTILPEWWDLLTPADSTTGGGAFTVTPYFEPDVSVSSW